MTAIGKGGYVAASGSPGLGIHSLDHFVLQVPDGAVARDFYEQFGLHVEEKDRTLLLRTFGNDHVWGTVVEGPYRKMHHMSYGAYADDVPRFKAHLEALGVRLLDPPAGFESNGIWFVGFDDVLMEIKAAPKTSLDDKAPASFVSAPAGRRGAGLGHIMVERARPIRLAHCLVFTSDVLRAIEFYSRALGLRLSDRSGDIVAFMHGIHGSDHHLLAFAKSHGPGLHHCSWDVGSIESIGRGALYMAGKGFQRGWGVPKGVEWDTRDFAGEDALALWGPEPPANFVVNTQTQR